MVEIIVSGNEFDKHIRENINRINVSNKETKAYLHGLFKGLLYTEADLSKQSITILYSLARDNYDFHQFQRLADWILFIRTGYPASLRASPEYYDTIARSSYYRCYLILNKKWAVFEELSDCFPFIVEELQTVNILA